MNNSLPAMSSVARMYEVLSHVKSYPVPVKTVAIMTGMDEEDVRKFISPTLYKIVDGYIQHKKASEQLEQMSAIEVDALHQSTGLAVYCKDGRPVWLHADDEFRFCAPPDNRLYMLALVLQVSAAQTTSKEVNVNGRL